MNPTDGDMTSFGGFQPSSFSIQDEYIYIYILDALSPMPSVRSPLIPHAQYMPIIYTFFLCKNVCGKYKLIIVIFVNKNEKNIQTFLYETSISVLGCIPYILGQFNCFEILLN